MADTKIAAPVELTDAELDAVAAGILGQRGLVNVNVESNDVQVVVIGNNNRND